MRHHVPLVIFRMMLQNAKHKRPHAAAVGKRSDAPRFRQVRQPALGAFYVLRPALAARCSAVEAVCFDVNVDVSFVVAQLVLGLVFQDTKRNLAQPLVKNDVCVW